MYDACAPHHNRFEFNCVGARTAQACAIALLPLVAPQQRVRAHLHQSIAPMSTHTHAHTRPASLISQLFICKPRAHARGVFYAAYSAQNHSAPTVSAWAAPAARSCQIKGANVRQTPLYRDIIWRLARARFCAKYTVFAYAHASTKRTLCEHERKFARLAMFVVSGV